MMHLLSPRYLLAALILAGVIVASFLLSVPHTREVSPPVAAAPAATTTPAVTLADVYKKGMHTLSGTVLSPDACAPVSASAALLGGASTTESIALAITLSPTEGVCLELPTALPFSATVAAPKNVPVTVTVNGAPASTTPA